MKKLFIFFCLAIVAVPASAQSITFTENELYPEGIDYNPADKYFYVTSLHYGKIGKVDAQGHYYLFVDDPEVPSAIGCRIDSKNNQLIVCVSDPGVSIKTNPEQQRKIAKLAFYDLTTGKRNAMVDLAALNTMGAANFANDIALDREGNAYVTNSFAPIIYKVNTKTYAAEVWAMDPQFQSEGFGLNGIACTAGGSVLTCNSSTGELFYVDKFSKKVDKITIAGVDLKGVDGMICTANGDLILMLNTQQKIVRIKCNPIYTNGAVSGEFMAEQTYPTTGVMVGLKLKVLNAKLNEIFTPGTKLTSDFKIQEIAF